MFFTWYPTNFNFNVISTFKQIKISSGLILPVLDARRNEVYSAIYDANYKLVKKESPELIDSKSFENFSNDNQLYFIGSGQQKCKELIKTNNNLNLYKTDELPSSKEMVLLSYEKDTKKVNVILQGACSGCPSSTITLKSGIETMLKDMLPGMISEVNAINGWRYPI